jgi:hypothetical protein
VTSSVLVASLGWTPARCQTALTQLVGEGLAWVDLAGAEPTYWFPGLFVAVP